MYFYKLNKTTQKHVQHQDSTDIQMFVFFLIFLFFCFYLYYNNKSTFETEHFNQGFCSDNLKYKLCSIGK